MFIILVVFILILELMGRGVGAFLLKSPDKIVDKYHGSEQSKSPFVKKYQEADLKVFSSTVLRVGLIFSIGLTIFAFTWTSYERGPGQLEEFEEIDDFEIEPPQTEQKPPPPPPPPPPEIEVVEDEEILEEEPEIEDIEVEEDEIVEAPVEEEEVIEEPEIFTIVEDMPRFPGCEKKASKQEKEDCANLELRKYLSKVNYPPIAIENDIEGKVFIRFVIDEKGDVTNVEVARGADKILDKAAKGHIEKMPKWTPGKQRGKPAKVQFVVPINFKLG